MATRGAIVRGSPPNGWNKPTGHSVTDLGEPTSGDQYGADIRLVTAEDGSTLDFDTSSDDQESWDTEADDASFSPFADVAEAAQAGFAGYFHSQDGGEFSVSLTWESATAVVPPLDGLTPTAAWSASRPLFSAYEGAVLEEVTGTVSQLLDQTGNSRPLIGQSGSRPALSSAGANNRACAAFDGVDDTMSTVTVAISSLIGAGAGYIIASAIVDAITTNGANIENNDAIFSDSGGFMGFHLKNGGGTTYTGHGYNWDGNRDVTTHTLFPLGEEVVVEWRHDGGNLLTRINGGTWQSAASGNTTTLTNSLRLALGAASSFTQMKLFEMACFSTVPDEATRDALVDDFMAHIGAA